MNDGRDLDPASNGHDDPADPAPTAVRIGVATDRGFEIVDSSLIEGDHSSLTVSSVRSLPHGTSLVVLGTGGDHTNASGWRLARRAVVPNEPSGEMHLRIVPPEGGRDQE